MICSQCQQEGKQSSVMIGGATSTLVMPMSYYDEQGVFHQAKDNNIHTTYYNCSNGHQWTESNK
jgi:hypothetical protein